MPWYFYVGGCIACVIVLLVAWGWGYSAGFQYARKQAIDDKSYRVCAEYLWNSETHPEE